MPRNSFTKAEGTGRSKAVNRNAFYWSPVTGRKANTKKDGNYIYFASELEFKTYKRLSNASIDFLYQPDLPLISSTANFSGKSKKWDFKLVGETTIIECKGQWILSQKHRDKKYLFLNECQLAENNGFRIILVSDLGPTSKRKPVKIGPYTAVHYEDLQSVLHSS